MVSSYLSPSANSPAIPKLLLQYDHLPVSWMSTNIVVHLDGRENFGRTAEAIKNHICDAALLQGGNLQQDRLRYMEDHVLSAGEYQ
jgi:hypothetical protein